MDISKVNIENAYNVGEIKPKTPQQKKIEHVSQKKVSDGVSLKEEINEYKQVIKELPDVREEEVRRIKEAIRQGTYKVSAKEVAKRILEDIILGAK